MLTPQPSELFIYMPVVAMQQLCASNFVATVGEGLFCSRMTMLLCTKCIKNDLLSLVWMKLTGLHKAKTWTQLSTFEVNWNAHCVPVLIVQHQCLTSLTMRANPCSYVTSNIKPSQKLFLQKSEGLMAMFWKYIRVIQVQLINNPTISYLICIFIFFLLINSSTWARKAWCIKYYTQTCLFFFYI